MTTNAYDRMREALELIATPMRPDGTWNRDRAACRDLARKTLDAVYIPREPRALDLAHTLWAMAQSPAPIEEVCERMAAEILVDLEIRK